VAVPNRFAADFYVSDRLLQNAEEFFGQHSLGSTIETVGEVGRNAVIRDALRGEILSRSRALVEFIIGLSHYGANDSKAAFAHFQAAQSIGEWRDEQGKEVLYLFLGNAAGKLEDLDGADRFYDRALELSPQYARALVGRAEVLFHRARGACEADAVDVGGLARSDAAYEAAKAAQIQPALSDVPTKVALGRARVHWCLSQAGAGDYLPQAEQEFQQVVDEFRRGNQRVRQLAAESYGGLGFVHLERAGADGHRQAADAFQNAADLTLDPDRKAFYASMRGLSFSRLGDTKQAAQAYDEAIRLARNPDDRAEYQRARAALPR
jgi:tetratricopeptide (TPR) repeat protein